MGTASPYLGENFPINDSPPADVSQTMTALKVGLDNQFTV
jgi:hypothetical protein